MCSLELNGLLYSTILVTVGGVQKDESRKSFNVMKQKEGGSITHFLARSRGQNFVNLRLPAQMKVFAAIRAHGNPANPGRVC